MKPREMIHVVCKTTSGSQTLSHIAQCERLRAADGAAINHITHGNSLCGRPVESSRVFSNPWEELSTAAASRACQTCLDVLADERIRKAC